MLQLIFNEVLILLHHPFLVFADSQAQLYKESSQPTRPSKGRSSISSIKSPRSRRSSSTSKSPYTSTPRNLSQTEDRFKATRSLPPFLNSCTKAAEAITFLIDHLLRTTPEWLVCHNEVDSALHIAERVHALNVSLADGAAAGNISLPMASINLQHAKSQFKRTRSFRTIVSELDQFTMSSGYRPELVTQEYRIRGSAGERLMRCMRQILIHKRSADYFRLPRSPPGKDANIHGPEYDVDPALPGGQDHLEMRLAFANERIWIRYYNIRIKDGEESRNGAESWVEILTPYTPVPDYDIDLGDEAQDFRPASDRTMTIFENENDTNNPTGDAHPHSRKRSSNDYSPGGLGEPMDPPQVSSSALMELFRNPDPSGLGQYSAIPTERGGSYDPNQQHQPPYSFQPHPHSHHNHHQPQQQQQPFDRKEYGPMEPGYDTSIYLPGNYSAQDVSLENFDRIEPPLSLESPSHERVTEDQSFRVFHPDQQGRGYPDHHQPYPPNQLMQVQAPVQRQHNFQNFEMQGPPILGFENTLSSPSYSSPGSPTVTSSELSIGLGLISNPPLTVQSQLSYDVSCLGLIQHHFPNHAPQASSSSLLGVSDPSHPLSLSQQLDSSFATASTQQAVRPFYGMPMGGFMSPTLAALPEIRSHNRNIHNLLQSPSIPEASTRFSSAPSISVASITAEVSTAKSSSPASPLIQSTYRMVLSPTTDALQGISNRLNSWNGLSSATESEQDQESNQEYQQPTFPLMDYPVNGVPITHRGSSSSTSQYASSWSSSSPHSESINTPSSIQTETSRTDLMDGVVASPTLSKGANSAVPDLPNAGHGDWD